MICSECVSWCGRCLEAKKGVFASSLACGLVIQRDINPTASWLKKQSEATFT